jgi:hypothetical protein
VEDLEERVLDHEICLLADEAIKNHFRFDLNADTPRTLMARAQVVMVHMMMEYLMELEEWGEFLGATSENLHLQEKQYREARASNDRKMARVYLARVRILTRLLKRLGDFKRHQLIALSFPPVATGSSPPPLALRTLREELVRRGEL